MNSKSNFVTGTVKVYHLCGNDWYAVEQDDEKVMLVDTDGCIADEVMITPWSDAEYADDEDANNGQCLLDYVNSIADKYFSSIKYAIIPRNIDCKNDCGVGQGELQNAYIWAMSKDEFESNKDIAGAISQNANDWIWTRTFNKRWDGWNCTWCVYNSSGNLSGNNVVTNNLAVVPAFYLSKSAIDYIAKDGEIILKPSTKVTTNTKLTQSDAETLLNQVIQYAEELLKLDNLVEDYLPNKTLLSDSEIEILEKILFLAKNSVTNK